MWEAYLCKKKHQKLSIIYLTLVAFPIIDHEANPDLRTLLTRLHHSFSQYIHKYNIENNFAPSYFQFLKLYVKSFLTLNIRLSFLYEIFVHDRLETFTQKIIVFINVCGQVDLGESYFATRLGQAKTFMRILISSLSSDKYANIILESKKLCFYEDIKNKHLSIINEDLIQSLFSKCVSHSADAIKTESPEVYINDEYKMFTETLSNCDNYTNNLSRTPNSEDKSGSPSEIKTDSNT
ncbi:hypothetical protein RF11_02413 [Thelohanellus kitauei]|uniref:Uncharacterized protein n=1 Tax=Thelohanellus kitauei TaxID=669202 RepID=A0A0C2MWF8_THEKT|nr:hypothetical protein RF11_02413 [Thelohanellus kitauei]